MKTNYRRFYYFSLLAFLFMFASCEEEIVYEINSVVERFVVVEGRITNEEKAHIIRLTRSDDYFSNTPPSLVDIFSCKITEIGSGNIYAVSAVDTGIGYYQTEFFAGIVGEEYEISFEFQGEDYSAISYLDSVSSMDSINVEYEYFSFFEAGFYKIKMFALEPDPIGDYYIANLYINDTLYNTKLSLTTYFDDEQINGNYFVGVDMYYIPQEQIIRDTNYIRLELMSISREEYNFIEAFLSETSSNGSMFSGPSADVPTNILSLDSDNRGFGFFSASATTSAETTLYKVHDESTNNLEYKK